MSADRFRITNCPTLLIGSHAAYVSANNHLTLLEAALGRHALLFLKISHTVSYTISIRVITSVNENILVYLISLSKATNQLATQLTHATMEKYPSRR